VTEDALFDVYIEAARDYVESHTGRTIHQKTLEITLNEWPRCDYIALPRATPLISITSVIYTDSDGNATTWSPSEYIADTDSMPGRLDLAYGEQWPSATLLPANGIRIRYVAGIVTASPESEAPGYLKYPVMLLVAGMYENRESEFVPDRMAIETIALKYGVEAFIARARVESNIL
jgi:uncharacterized phiE125 gp8 family phage protein